MATVSPGLIRWSSRLTRTRLDRPVSRGLATIISCMRLAARPGLSCGTMAPAVMAESLAVGIRSGQCRLQMAMRSLGRNTSDRPLHVWTADSNGNYTGNLIGAVSGNSYALESLEPVFNQDLNGDGVTGLNPLIIQTDTNAFGSTSLARDWQQLFPVCGRRHDWA